MSTIECTACAVKIKESANFCHQCGNQVLKQCHACTEVLDLNARFCSHCGKSVIALETPPSVEKRPMPKTGEQNTSNKKTKTDAEGKFTARMFHPYNGRNDFELAESNVQFANVTMTPLLESRILQHAQENNCSRETALKHFGF